MFKWYAPTIKYIKFPDNDAADALSSLPLVNSDVKYIKISMGYLAESYWVDKLDGDTFSLTYQIIDKYQSKYNKLVDKIKHSNYH